MGSAPHSGAAGIAPAGHAATGPTHAGDVIVEWRGLEPVPVTSRYGKPARVGVLWFAAELCPVPFYVGVIGTASFIGLSFWQNVMAIVIGNVLGCAPVAGLSIMGPRTGLVQMALARRPFGKGITLVALVAYVESVIFIALAAIFGAQALQVVFHMPFLPALLLVFGLEAVISIIGYELLHLFERGMAVLVGIGFLILTVILFTKAHQIHVIQKVHGAQLTGSFILMVAITFGFAFGWSINAADYCRYLDKGTSSRSLFWWVWGGLFAGCVWVELLGLAAGSILPNTSPMLSIYKLIGGGVIGIILMLTIYLGVVAEMCIEDYSAGLQVIAAGIRILRPIMTGISVVIALLITLWLNTGTLAAKATNLVLLSTYWVAPFAAVVAINWWQRRDDDDFVRVALRPYSLLRGGANGVVAVVVGFVVSLPFSDTTLGTQLAAHGGVLSALFGWVSTHLLYGGDLAYYVGGLVGGGLYYLLERIRPRPAIPSDEILPSAVSS